MKKLEPVVLAVVLNVLVLSCSIALVESTGAHKYVNCSQLCNCSEWPKNFTNLKVVLLQDITIEEDIEISNVRNFSIAGNCSNSKQNVTFNCSKLSSFIITNSSFIEIQNIRIINCGKRIVEYKQPGNIFPNITSTAIFISSVSFIKIVDVVIGNSCGHGIIAVNVTDNFTLENIAIYGNSTHPDYCECDCILFGGMLVLNLLESNKDTAQRNTTITITRCNFFNITSNAQSALGTNNVDDENVTLLPIEYINSSAIGLILHQICYHYDVKIENVNITNFAIINAPLIFFHIL